MHKLKKVIAIVEDDPSMLRGIARLLSAHGFNTQAFLSAEKFLDAEGARGAACLILDINLGGMSGIELRRKLAEAGSAIPVIFITAVDDDVTQRKAIEIGCFAFLRKPFPGSALIGAINRAIA